MTKYSGIPLFIQQIQTKVVFFFFWITFGLGKGQAGIHRAGFSGLPGPTTASAVGGRPLVAFGVSK